MTDNSLKFSNPTSNFLSEMLRDRTLTLVEIESLRTLDEERHFTIAERHAWEAGERRLQYLGGRLAAKQSILSYLPELSLLDVEIQRLPHGAPAVALSDRGKIAAANAGITGWLLSISHTSRYAVAWAIAMQNF